MISQITKGQEIQLPEELFVKNAWITIYFVKTYSFGFLRMGLRLDAPGVNQT